MRWSVPSPAGPASRSWTPSGSSRSPPAPCATPRTATPSSPSCASASRSRRADPRRRRGGAAHLPRRDRRARRRASRPLVIDIGGGSTELVVGDGAEVDFHASLQAGTVRHTERHLRHRPARPRRARGARRRRRAALIDDAGRRRGARARASDGIAVAGTPTSLAAIELELDPYDPERVHGHVLAADGDPAHALAARLDAAGGAPRGHRPAPRPRADDRRRRGHPDRGDARLRPRARSRSPSTTSSGVLPSTRR